MSPRTVLQALVVPLLPGTWTVLHYAPTAGGGVTGPTVWMQQTRVEPNDAAPRANDDTTITLTLVQPELAPPRADDLLEERLDLLLNALDQIPNLTWSDATRSTADETYPAYSVPVTFLTTRKDT